MKSDQSKLDSEIQKVEKLIAEIPYDVMRQDELEAELQKAGIKNFVDPQFPPRDSSIYDSLNDEYPFKNVVHWRRPTDFMKGTP